MSVRGKGDKTRKKNSEAPQLRGFSTIGQKRESLSSPGSGYEKGKEGEGTSHKGKKKGRELAVQLTRTTQTYSREGRKEKGNTSIAPYERKKKEGEPKC